MSVGCDSIPLSTTRKGQLMLTIPYEICKVCNITMSELKTAGYHEPYYRICDECEDRAD